MALVVGYQGSKYYGLQMDSNSTLPTIERCLEGALHAIGCIRDSNHLALAKIGWSRSSRTDKGVHAARIVVSAKLEIDEQNWLVGRDLKAPRLAGMINGLLPDDIRVFSAAKVNQGFRARESCHFREYEYLLPLQMLTQESSPSHSSSWKGLPTSADQAIADLNQVFAKMVGTLSHHNFHKLSPKNVRARRHTVGARDTEGTEGIQEEQEEDEEEEEEELMVERGGEGVEEEGGSGKMLPLTDSQASAYVSTNFDPWVKRDRDVAPKTRCTIYLMRAEECRTVDGMDMICIRIRGQAFLLHQIRLLISSAILVVRGVVPLSSIDAAFLLPFHINFPLAPAEGLILVDAGFSRNANGKTYGINGVPGNDADYVIMESDEYKTSEDFKQKHIYTKVASDFAANEGDLMFSFLRFIDERFRVPPATETEWRELCTIHREKQLAEGELRDQREYARIQRETTYFRNEMLEKDEAFSSFFCLADDNSGGAPKRKGGKAVPHKKLLNNSLHTDLVIHYQVQPSSVVVSNALRALATRMVLSASSSDDLSPRMSNREIIAFMETKGTLEYWAGLPKHSMIE